ncbi:hypothetical protein THIAE_05110 [Thiomicrospira aerophila AL3]|uniref:DUF4168 domain-containing protein n=1 Tax=Thiomicrospira aerophila AL3 TaxID=717772 RepID=W0DYB6_9GAMM|nr:DUF4168 domain-containing protein [Thiomicrospira aerophila]AHF02248.1 hypothetical protein THIAE_05110 [Thiomicrospira aerophila AL3]
MIHRLFTVIALSLITVFPIKSLANAALTDVPEQIPSQTPTAAPTDLQLEQFLTSLFKIEDLHNHYQQTLAEKPVEEITEQLLAEVHDAFNEEATDIIKAQGLTLPVYSEMLNLMENDPHFLARVQRKADEMH